MHLRPMCQPCATIKKDVLGQNDKEVMIQSLLARPEFAQNAHLLVLPMDRQQIVLRTRYDLLLRIFWLKSRQQITPSSRGSGFSMVIAEHYLKILPKNSASTRYRMPAYKKEISLMAAVIIGVTADGGTSSGKMPLVKLNLKIVRRLLNLSLIASRCC